MVGEFAKLLKNLIGQLVEIFGSASEDWDRKSYESVVGCLLMEDEIAVKEAVNQLVLEGKVLAIPPLYLASQKHPSFRVREYCWKAVGNLDSIHKINQLTAGRNIKDALDSLISEYGHFKDNYF